MLIFAAFWALLGMYCLFLPRRFFLVGSRWQLRDGDRAEASDTYVMVTRFSGVVFLVAAGGFALWNFSFQTQADTRESVSKAWDISAYPNGTLRVINDPEVEEVTDVMSSIDALAGARTALPTWKTAVVGRDEVGNLGVGVKDGDLWLAAVAGSCKPAALMVDETDESVTVAMTATSTPFGDGDFIPCYSTNPFYLDPSIESIVIVRVPLDKPLGGREVLSPNPPERENFGVPLPPIPGMTRTPTPTPTP